MIDCELLQRLLLKQSMVELLTCRADCSLVALKSDHSSRLLPAGAGARYAFGATAPSTPRDAHCRRDCPRLPSTPSPLPSPTTVARRAPHRASCCDASPNLRA